jgi:periplasmic protein CpxP/Spy
MKTFRIRLMAALVAVLMGTMMAKAQTTEAAPAPTTPAPHAMHHRHFHYANHRMGFFAGYLNLSDAQHAQMKTIMQNERATMKPLMQQLHQARQQLHQFEEGTYDEAKVRALAAQQAQTQVELTVAQTKLHSDLFQVLTPDQQAKMKQVEAHRAARMQQRMQQAPPAQQPEQE